MGGGTKRPIFCVEEASTFKWVDVIKWNFFTFPKYQKQNFLTKFESNFNLFPYGGEGKNEVIENW